MSAMFSRWSVVRVTKAIAVSSMLVLLMVSQTVFAATISWSAAPFINGGDSFKSYTGTGQFNVNGNLIAARNYGNGSGSATTLIGGGSDGSDIDFLADGDAPIGWGQSNSAYHSTLANKVTAGGAFFATSGVKTLTMGTGSAVPGSIGVIVGDISFVPGAWYRVQYLIMDGRDEGFLGGSTIIVDGTNYGSFATGTFGLNWGDALLLTGIFQADNTFQSFDVEIIRNDSSSAGGQINALMIHQIPEPTSMVLFLLGAATVAVCCVKRRLRLALQG